MMLDALTRMLRTVILICLILLAAGCRGGLFGKHDPYRPPATARESCEQLVLGRSFGISPGPDILDAEIDRCLKEYSGLFHAKDPELTELRSRCVRRSSSADIDITVTAVNTHAGRNLEFWIELRNGQIVQSGTSTQLGTFPTLRYRVPPGTPFYENSPVALRVGTVTVPSPSAFPVDLGFDVVVDADNEYAEANEYDNVRPSGCSNIQ
jgi:hypothetical protein